MSINRRHSDYCEILIDSHIADWNKVFLSRYSPKNYVDILLQKLIPQWSIHPATTETLIIPQRSDTSTVV